MGQTLTHGIYLPDEGERNCYDGLASNWSILDGAVGTVAEHTTQIAGKAPAVHTHTKSQITDFPVYGTTAGTICEGNDSRLSDARTPVAHTHTKSEITDFPTNVSAFTNDSGYANDSDVVHKAGNETVWGTKTFTKIIKNQSENLEIGVIPSSNTDIGYRVVDKNNTTTANLQYSQYTSGNSQFALNLRTKDSNNNIVNKSVMLNTDQYGTWFNFRPSDNSSISLGSTTYRWSAVYSDSYYYGTTAWGLDQANVWTGWNQFNNLAVYSNDVTYNQAPSSTVELPSIRIFGGGRYCGAFDYLWRSTGENVIRLSLGSYKSDGSFGYWACNFGVPRDFSVGGQFGTPAFYPNTDGYNLGDSTHRWKTLNGINPGALSLPNLDATIGSTYDKKQDISGDLVPDSYNNARFTARMPGWVYVDFNVSNATITEGTQMLAQFKDSNLANTTFAINFERTPSTNHILIYAPVIANRTYILELNFTGQSIEKAYVIPCLGNV